MNYLSVGEAAKRLGVSVDVVRSLVKRGELRAIRTGGGHRRIRDDDVERRRTTQRASRNGPQVGRSPNLERRPVAQSRPRTWLVEPDRDRHFEEDPPSFEDLEAEGQREAAKERAAADAKAQAAAAEAERQRLEGLKKYGRDAARSSLVPTDWQARVVEDLEEFVTPKRLPSSLPLWEAQQIVKSRVDGIIKQYRDAEDQRRKQEDDQRKIDWLITSGKNYARSETVLDWDSSEQDRARREVESELKQKVKADMSYGHVKDLVDDVLKQWEDDTEDDDGDEDEDQDESDGEAAAEEDDDAEW